MVHNARSETMRGPIGVCRALVRRRAGRVLARAERGGRQVWRCRRGTASLEFALLMTPLLTMLFGFVATNTVFTALTTMQNNAQYAARLMASGQVKSLTTGTLSSANTTATSTCSNSLTSSQVEYYACNGLPGWGTFTVTATQNCAVPSVTVTLTASGATAAVGDVYQIFTGKTIRASAVLMKEGSCP